MNDKHGGIFGDKNASQSFVLATFKNHYFIYDTVPVSHYYLKNREAIKEYANKHQWEQTKRWMTNMKTGNIYKVNKTKCSTMSSLYRNDVDVAKVHHYVHLKQDIQSLEFSDNNTKLIKEKAQKERSEQIIYYIDFEICYNQELNNEIEFLLCVQDMKGTDKKTFIGNECGTQLLEYLPNNSIVYFHNLGFDGRLLMKYGVKNNIIKGSRIIQQTNAYKGKTITLRDSYSMFTQKLANFPKCFPNEFKGLNIQKEVFPYRYYTFERINTNKPIGIINECGDDELP